MEEYREEELTLPAEPMLLHMGPSHPAMHGTVRCVLKLDGETILGSDVQIGYLHRGFEKECEAGTWTQVFPYTDRLNYASPLLNNIGYALAVEKLLGITVPPRAQYMRVILGELARICDHCVCSAAVAMELGAFTVFLYLVKAREWIFDVLEEVTGARVTPSAASAACATTCRELATASLRARARWRRSPVRKALCNHIFMDPRWAWVDHAERALA